MTRTFVLITAVVLAASVIRAAQTPKAADAGTTPGAAPSAAAEMVTRGIGVYPGDPREDAAPSFRIDSTTYRNLAHLRPAYQSSAYDYNLTAQLVTDGIIETAMPRWVVVATGQQGVISTESRDVPRQLDEGSLSGFSRQQMAWPKNKREWVLDGNWVTGLKLRGTKVWVQLELHGGAEPLAIDSASVVARVQAGSSGPENWACEVMASDDGTTWSALGQTSGMSMSSGEINPVVKFASPSRHRYLRILFDDTRALSWTVSEIAFSLGGVPVRVGGPHQFSSAWMSAGRGEEWVYVDLGAPCTFDRVALHWLARPADAMLQASDDAATWRTIQPLPSAGERDDVKLAAPARGRYVRVLMRKPATAERYALSEFEVFGRGGPVPVAKPRPAQRADGRADLTGGGWKIQRDSLVKADGRALSSVGFADDSWVMATVPATVLSSYWNVGALPDPNYGDNQLAISDAFFHADFWYRTEFATPSAGAGRTRWLNFDGVNLNADVYLNGEKVGRIEGGFARARFDVTSRLRASATNALAIRVEKVTQPGSVKEKTFDHPDTNGGALGADNPTYHASIGWDWIPTIRGRETGIWNDVYLTDTGMVTVDHPSVTSTLPLPDISKADVRLTAELTNGGAAPMTGALRGRFGDITFSVPVTVAAKTSQTVTLDPKAVAALSIASPRLWWPNGYGEQNLYDVELRVEAADGAVSDVKRFKAGIRQFTYTMTGNSLRMWINGRRFIPRGGNWGFPESMLRYRGREYDVAVRYHKDLNFNIIRNWVGQTGDDEFYDACDRHGIVVWQDFWLANPWDGPDPNENGVFMANAADMVNAVRTHPSVGLYCGRNEGYPPKPIDDAIRALLAARHADVPYISSSADDVVSGHGPYRAMGVNHYFTKGAPGKMHSEMGMPNIMTLDSLKTMMPESSLWPLGRMYGLHDFSLNGAQGGASFLERIQQSYGGVRGIAEWATIAQFVNYEGYRAMYEAQSRSRMGLLIWMSHSAWPSLVWQTYDYYFEPTAGYFGAKKGSEPLHIQWNPTTEMVEVVNYSAGLREGLTATAQVIDLDGQVRWEKSAAVSIKDDATQSAIAMEYPLGVSAVHFIRLRLTKGSELVSDNFYWRGIEDGNFLALRDLAKAPLESSTTVSETPTGFRAVTELVNNSSTPAIMVRLKLVRDKTGDRILPAIYSDNYVSLMPGERRTITTDVTRADARGERPRMVVEGFNVGEVTYKGAAKR